MGDALKRSRAMSGMASATMWTAFCDTLKRSRRLGGRLRRGGHPEISHLCDHQLKSFVTIQLSLVTSRTFADDSLPGCAAEKRPEARQ